VIARLGIGSLGVGDASSIGRALLARLLAAVTTLGDVPPEQRPPLSIVVDEAHLFAGGRALGAMLAQVRKFGAALSLGTQTPSRLGALLPEVLTNCATVLAMRLPEREAKALADRGGPPAIRQIVSLPRYHAVAFLEDADAEAEPRVIHPIRMLPGRPDHASEAAETARQRFGRRPADATRGDVERWALSLEGLDECVEGLAGRLTARELWRRRAEVAASSDTFGDGG
jgi:DNA helicase HerA-like ATPase